MGKVLPDRWANVRQINKQTFAGLMGKDMIIDKKGDVDLRVGELIIMVVFLVVYVLITDKSRRVAR